MTQYFSAKPAYQTHAGHSSPNWGTTAVFEWEAFSSLEGDFSEEALSHVCKRVSRDIIERPYHYDPHRVYDVKGKKMHYVHTDANNTAPPPLIKGGVLYKQNHGTGHALRQMVYADKLIDVMVTQGNAYGKSMAEVVNNHPELKSAIKLAAYCKRIGRTFDHEQDHHTPTIYSKRSADMFSLMAKELGYNKTLVSIISNSMLEGAPNGINYSDIYGVSGQSLQDFSENVLMAAHKADLVRIFSVDLTLVDDELRPYFEAKKCRSITQHLVAFACMANLETGNGVVAQDTSVKHKTGAINGQRLVQVSQNSAKVTKTLLDKALLPTTAQVKKTVPKPIKETAQIEQTTLKPIHSSTLETEVNRVRPPFINPPCPEQTCFSAFTLDLLAAFSMAIGALSVAIALTALAFGSLGIATVVTASIAGGALTAVGFFTLKYNFEDKMQIGREEALNEQPISP